MPTTRIESVLSPRLNPPVRQNTPSVTRTSLVASLSQEGLESKDSARNGSLGPRRNLPAPMRSGGNERHEWIAICPAPREGTMTSISIHGFELRCAWVGPLGLLAARHPRRPWQAGLQGQWTTCRARCNNPVHMALMTTASVIVAGSGNVPPKRTSGWRSGPEIRRSTGNRGMDMVCNGW